MHLRSPIWSHLGVECTPFSSIQRLTTAVYTKNPSLVHEDELANEALVKFNLCRVLGLEPNVIDDMPAVEVLLFKIIIETIDLTLSVFLYAIIIQAILSWVNPDPYNPVAGLLNSITWPILKHFKKLIPNMGGFDISPIFAIIAIMFVQQSIHYIFRMILGG